MRSSARSQAPRKAVPPPGIARDDSDDELGDEDLPWEWIYGDAHEGADANGTSRKRKRTTLEGKIVGARMGSFECRLGECVLLKAEGSNEAWVGIIDEFMDDDGDDGEKAASFMWFSTEQEIRNKQKKRTDFLPNELYITPSFDDNPLTSINGKAKVMSLSVFQQTYPNGKVPRNSPDYGKVFVCRRACNTRTTSYSDELIWEELYDGTAEAVSRLQDFVTAKTKATRRRKPVREKSPDAYEFDGEDDDGAEKQRTPKKSRTYNAITPSKRKGTSKAVTPSSHRKYVFPLDFFLSRKLTEPQNRGQERP